MKSLKLHKYALNPLHINPQDAIQRGLAEGDFADIWNDHGSISVQIVMDATLRPGVVALSHGYGHQQAPGMSRANAFPGVNVNRLMPAGPESYDKLSNMAHLTGIVVKVKKTDIDAACNEVGL
jgi:anaerobic selenocysteine-containing dehydrogenase